MILSKLRRLFTPKRSSAPVRLSRDQQIANTKRAMLRAHARCVELWESVDYPGMDEHRAALGGTTGEYEQLRQKLARQAAWLAVLLRKRGQPDDIKLAWMIDRGSWP